MFRRASSVCFVTIVAWGCSSPPETEEECYESVTNCGGCGKVCSGGDLQSCVDGTCRLADALLNVPVDDIVGLALVGDDLIFTSTFGLFDPGYNADLARRVRDGIYRVPKSGGTPAVLYDEPGRPNALAVAADRDLAIWGTVGGPLRRGALGGGTVTDISSSSICHSEPGGLFSSSSTFAAPMIAVNSAGVAWTRRACPDPERGIQYLDFDTGIEVAVTTDLSWTLALDEDRVTWVEWWERSLTTARVTGEPNVLAERRVGDSAFVSDGVFVYGYYGPGYWERTLFRTPLAGGATTEVARLDDPGLVAAALVDRELIAFSTLRAYRFHLDQGGLDHVWSMVGSDSDGLADASGGAFLQPPVVADETHFYWQNRGQIYRSALHPDL